VIKLEIEFVKPPFKWHEFVPLIVLFLGLAFAMVLFYSSSAYIMLYSHDDALLAIENGLNVNPQVFEAGAIRKAFSKDFVGGLYILFFVFIPFAIAYVAHISDALWKISFNSVIAVSIAEISPDLYAFVPSVLRLGNTPFCAVFPDSLSWTVFCWSLRERPGPG